MFFAYLRRNYLGSFSFSLVFGFIRDIKIHLDICNSAYFVNSFRIFVSISSAKESKTFFVAWVGTVADRVEFAVWGSLCTQLCCMGFLVFLLVSVPVFFSSSNSKQSDNTCARSIQIPSGRRQNTSGSECTSHPVARSISTFGPLEEDEKESQKINHIIPTGSLPATLQGPTVCNFSTLNVIVSSVQ